jgi:hypothetical protein
VDGLVGELQKLRGLGGCQGIGLGLVEGQWIHEERRKKRKKKRRRIWGERRRRREKREQLRGIRARRVRAPKVREGELAARALPSRRYRPRRKCRAQYLPSPTFAFATATLPKLF